MPDTAAKLCVTMQARNAEVEQHIVDTVLQL